MDFLWPFGESSGHVVPQKSLQAYNSGPSRSLWPLKKLTELLPDFSVEFPVPGLLVLV